LKAKGEEMPGSADHLKSQAVRFDLASGLCPDRPSMRRKLSAMAGMFNDQAAFEAALAQADDVVYEFYDIGLPNTASEIAFGTSITYPGKIGDEYFMTKGHFHTVLDTAEVYYCLRGQGYMLMESPEARWEAQEFRPGVAVYIPPRYAHRSVNVSETEPLVTFFAFRGDAGHDYRTIETKGFRKLIVERDGRPTIIDNPRWK
jgi:glucose-6-phosphate isomerase